MTTGSTSANDRLCATKDCHHSATPRSEWCASCRASLYRWWSMTPTQRDDSAERAHLRWSRVWRFRGITGRRRGVQKVVRRRHGRHGGRVAGTRGA